MARYRPTQPSQENNLNGALCAVLRFLQGNCCLVTHEEELSDYLGTSMQHTNVSEHELCCAVMCTAGPWLSGGAWGGAAASAALTQPNHHSLLAFSATRTRRVFRAVVLLCCALQGIGCLVTHEEELSDYLSMSVLLSQPPRSPSHPAARDSYLATLDFVEALCETSSSLTRFPPVSAVF